MQAPILLAPRLLEILRIILRPYRHALRPGAVESEGDVGVKRRVAALMLGHGNIVDPDARVIVHRPEMQDEPAAIP